MKPFKPFRKEKSQIKRKFQPRGRKTPKEESEFGPGKVDILVCRKCGAFYWYKSWHHRLDDYPELKGSKDLKFIICPACQMILNKKYEGEIILENVPENFREDIKTLTKNYGERAFEADPMDRIISFKEKKIKKVTAVRKRGATSRKEFKGLTDIQILATENQLAKRLAKKINEIYGGKLTVAISYSHKEDHKEDIVRIKIKF
ncbi:MAG: hypothetical protein ACE5J0_00065 [Candidatus Paceibacterales bacterium]